MTRQNFYDALFRAETVRSVRGPMPTSALLAVSLLLLTGCQSLSLSPFGRDELTESTAPAVVVGEPVAAKSAAEPASLMQTTKDSTTRVLNFVTGREQSDAERAKQLFQEADATFRQAASQEKRDAVKTYRASAKLFRKAAEASPGSALQQDAMYMEGESLFFADRLIDATEVYQTLQKEFPRSRHNDRVAARLFTISQYWIETVKADQGGWFPMNLTDAKKPRLDVEGHAIRVLDQIRYDDPTGRLADDATMAAAVEFMRQTKYEQADEFLTDLRETFTDSDHLFDAHMMGIDCKLQVYAGPKYSGLVLEEAEKLVEQTRQRFPEQLRDPNLNELLARSAAKIAYLRAERLAYRAEYREKRKEYGAARYYYNELLAQHGDTPQAEIARERLADIETLPAVPVRQLAFLTKIFPDSQRNTPLKTNAPAQEGTDTSSGTIFR